MRNRRLGVLVLLERDPHVKLANFLIHVFKRNLGNLAMGHATQSLHAKGGDFLISLAPNWLPGLEKSQLHEQTGGTLILCTPPPR